MTKRTRTKRSTRTRQSNARTQGWLMVTLGLTVAIAGATFIVFGTSLGQVEYIAQKHGAHATSSAYNAQEAQLQVAEVSHENDAQEAYHTSSTIPLHYIVTPKPLRAIYMTQCVVGTVPFRERLVRLIEETEVNAVVIDIKDYTGKLGFSTTHPDLAPSVSDKCGALDLPSFIKTLHEKNIYTIARVTVFQDPYYSLAHPELAVKFATPPGSVWRDHKGLSFIDVGAKPYWDYIVTISKEARLIGFDEINYDYIRFPSDGPMNNIHFDWAGDREKQDVLEEFFAFLHKAVKNPHLYPQGTTPPVISADLFGMVTTNYDDLNIGQVLERAMPYFDYIAPMVYPSHYPKGFNGWENPNTVPYDLIKYVLTRAVERATATSSPIAHADAQPIYRTVLVPPTGSSTATTTKKVFTGRYTKKAFPKNIIRPWLQDFDYGGNYDVEEVRAQIQATYDAGLDSWMLWAPSNRYTKGALEPFYSQTHQKATQATSTDAS